MNGTFTLTRGISEVYAAEVTADTIESYTAGTPFHLIPTGEMTRTVNSDSATQHFDNAPFWTIKEEGETDISITGAALRPAMIARLLGKDVDSTTGAILDSGEAETVYFALCAKCDYVDGTSEYIWFLKGYFDAPESSNKTIDDTTDANGTSLTFHAMKTIHQFTVGDESKGMKKVTIDTADTALKSTQTWNAQVVTPDNLGTICEAVA